jgi:hypothetical protein
MTEKTLEQKKAKRRKLDDNKCQFCGTTNEEHKEQHDQQLHVHHIRPVSEGGNNSQENLITVCKSCHNTLESRHRSIWVNKFEDTGIGKNVPDKLRSVKNQRDALLDRIEYLERLIRSAEVLDIVEGYYVNGEVILETYGTRNMVTANHKKAIKEYEEWGSTIRRTNLCIDSNDLENWKDRDSIRRQIDKKLKGDIND